MEVSRFSTSGEYLAVSSSDGRIKIWDTATNILKQEYVPSSHLTASCTCLEWAPGNQVSGRKKKRKRTLEGDVLTMGTATGGLVFYGVTKAQLLSHHKDIHVGKVTSISWSSKTLMLYSSGEDGYIIEWDSESSSVASRWRGSKSGLSAVQVIGEKLLSAAHGITLWDLKTKTAAMNFTGHPSLITQLEIVPETNYFVTMCQTERHLRIWSVNEKNSVLTLTVPEPASNFFVHNSADGQVTVTSVTQKGPLHVFKHKLNGPVKKPILPCSTLNVVESFDSNKLVTILASYIYSDDNDDVKLLIGYGSWLRLRFEKLATHSLEKETTIKREYSLQKKGKKTVHTIPDSDLVEIPDNVKHLQDGSEVLDEQSQSSQSKSRKRKTAGEDEEEPFVTDDGELPMEERITNLTIDNQPSTSVPSSSNLANLLSQGLHSKDVRILQSVLCRWDETVISTTVRSLPVQLIIPLLSEIRKMMGGKAQQNHSLIKWLKHIFQIHSAYLMACPSSKELLSPFLSLLRSRETLYPQMCQLKGKLELIKGNIQAKEYKSEQPNEALLVYQDESSDEDREEDTFLPSESEGFLESEDGLGVDDDGSTSKEEEDSESNSSDILEDESDDDMSDENEMNSKTAKVTKK